MLRIDDIHSSAVITRFPLHKAFKTLFGFRVKTCFFSAYDKPLFFGGSKPPPYGIS